MGVLWEYVGGRGLEGEREAEVPPGFPRSKILLWCLRESRGST